ncbi:hypothetical protein K4H00_22090, partial [Mycobacterium tuberculosis]|nr:hypothetical protein [Mycobacterium tuberculosis]
LVLQEAIQNLNGAMASALALVMTATSLAFAALVTLVLNRSMPWLSGRPSRPWTIPGWLVPAVNLVGPLVARLALAAALVLLLLPLVLVCVQ